MDVALSMRVYASQIIAKSIDRQRAVLRFRTLIEARHLSDQAIE
ncbi:MAG: hypothetical protein ACLP8A_17045 [Methylovirgula sp.]